MVDTDRRTGLFGAIECEVGTLQQLRGLSPVSGEHHDPDAYLQLKRYAGVIERASQALDDEFGLTRRRSSVDRIDKQHKSVGSDVAHAVWPTLMRRETPCYLGQYLIAGRMPERSNDAL